MNLSVKILRRIMQSCTIFMLLIFIGSKANSKVIKTSSGPKHVLISQSVIEVNDPFYPKSLLFTDKNVLNNVSFYINHDAGYAGVDFTASITFTVNYEVWDGSDFQPHTSNTETLEVEYKSGSGVIDKSVFQIKQGGHKMKVTIGEIKLNNTITTSSNKPANFPGDLLILEAQIEAESYYPFNTNISYSIPTVTSSPGSGELNLSWTEIKEADEYDLEWTYISYYKIDGTVTTDIALDPDLFRINSTRITTSDNKYAIPLIYEPGYILYRVRGVGRSAGSGFKQAVYGKWSSERFGSCTNTTCYDDKYKFDGHEKKLNWQFSANYSEEGKSKVAVSYFDGSLRNRQVVSKLNTEKVTIVGETIYDFQGRGAIQVLPAPTSNPGIHYYPYFNLNLNSTSSNKIPFSRYDFDEDLVGSSCDVKTKGMSTIDGASKYYSSNNGDFSLGFTRYIPDAKNFAFTQIEYTPDNTGRIAAQSGVGGMHTLGSGHETNYFYGKPQQEELIRLFGFEAGNSAHYKKNMVVDANGQVSVSYLDPQGRVIATSLAGAPPTDKVTPLESFQNRDISVDLLNKNPITNESGQENKKDVDKGTKTISTPILVSTEGEREFEYKLGDEMVSYLSENCTTVQRCYDCVYELKISLTDNCQDEKLLGPVDDKELKGVNDNCVKSNDPLFEKGGDGSWKTKPLKVGSYQLTKTLTVNKQKLDEYTEDYLNNDCIKGMYQMFLDSAMAEIDFSGCDISCDSCKIKVEELYNSNPRKISDETRDELLKQCEVICDGESPKCEAFLFAMLNDVSKGGQYGEYLKPPMKLIESSEVPHTNNLFGLENNSIVDVSDFSSTNSTSSDVDYDVSDFHLSVFKVGNVLPTPNGNWRYPNNVSKPGDPSHYYDAKGNKVYIKVRYDGDKFIPRINFTPYPLPKKDDYIMVEPQHLARLKDFMAKWDPEWARSLVVYHPEYPFYRHCLNETASNDFDANLLITDTYTEASTKFPAIFNLPVGAPDKIANIDYYFEDPLYPDDKDHINERIKKYTTSQKSGVETSVSLAQMAYIINFCPNSDLTVSGSCSACGEIPENFSSLMALIQEIPDVQQRIQKSDAFWNTYKNLYLSLKQEYQKKNDINFSIGGNCYNGCFNTEMFNPNILIQSPNNNFPIVFYPLYQSQYYNIKQPCNVSRYEEYKDKTPRWQNASQMLNKGEWDEAEVCYPSPVITSGTTYNDISKEAINPDPIDCPEKNLAIMQAAKLKAQAEIFMECGQCPMARNLQTLLDAIAKKGKFKSTEPPFLLSCYPQSEFPEFIPDLDDAVGGDGDLWWNFKEFTDTYIKVELTRGNSGSVSCTLEIKISGANTIYKISDIKEICCLKYTSHPTIFPTYEGNSFLANATVFNTQTNKDEKINIEGVSTCFQIASCDFPEQCTTAVTGIELQNLWNALLYSTVKVQTGTRDPDFFKETFLTQYNETVDDVTNIIVPPYDAMLTATLRDGLDNHLGEGINWKWKNVSNALNNEFEIFNPYWTESYEGQEQPKCTFRFYAEDGITPFDTKNVLFFADIRPDIDNDVDQQHYFKIKALVKNLDKVSYVKCKGYSKCFIVGDCISPLLRERVYSSSGGQ